MVVLFDTNVVLDVLLKRDGLFQESANAIKKCKKNGDKIYVSASAITDIYYILRRNTKSDKIAFEGIKTLTRLFQIAEVNSVCISKALRSELDDFEDAVLDGVATNIKADYIITRNTKHFKKSQNNIIGPDTAPLFRKMSQEELKNHYIG